MLFESFEHNNFIAELSNFDSNCHELKIIWNKMLDNYKEITGFIYARASENKIDIVNDFSKYYDRDKGKVKITWLDHKIKFNNNKVELLRKFNLE